MLWKGRSTREQLVARAYDVLVNQARTWRSTCEQPPGKELVDTGVDMPKNCLLLRTSLRRQWPAGVKIFATPPPGR